MITVLEIGLIVLIFFYLEQKIYQKLWDKHLHVTLQFSDQNIFEGEQSTLLEIIENRKKLPLALLKVKFQTHKNLDFGQKKGSKTTDQYYRNDVFHVAGGEKITRTIPFTGHRRGYYSISKVDCVASDLFISTEMVKTFPISQFFYVYPKPFMNQNFLNFLRQMDGYLSSRQHMLEDSFSIRGIREYQPYDDVKSIHWKASAKTGEWKVKEKDYISVPSVRIFFNIEDNGVLKKEECVEACLQIVSGLCTHFLKQGLSIACYGNGVDLETGNFVSVSSGCGKGILDKIYRTLARVDTNRPVVDFTQYFGEKLLQEDNNAYTFLVSPNHYASFVSLVETYQAYGGDYTWLYPVWESEDPVLPPSLQKHIIILHIR